MLSNKLSRTSSLIYQLRDHLPIHVLKKIYYAHVYPHLNYCNCIWSNTYQTHLLPLTLIHKRIIRNIAKANFLDHTEPLYSGLKILNIDRIRKLNLSLLMFKQIKYNEFQFPILTQEHNYNTRNRDLLLIPQHRTTLLSNSFTIQAIKVWNKLPQSLKLIDNIRSFKKKVVNFI